jgi:hypothetical protein
MVKFRNVAALDVGHFPCAELRVDEQLHRALVFGLSRRLAAHRDMFLEEPFAQPLHGWRLAGLVEFPGGVAAVLGFGDDLMGAHAGLLGRHGAVRADGDLAQPSLHAGHGDIDLPSARPDPHAEAVQFVVPMDRILRAGLDLVDHPFRQFRHR